MIVPNSIKFPTAKNPQITESFFNKKKFSEISIIQSQDQLKKKSFKESHIESTLNNSPKKDKVSVSSDNNSEDEESQSHVDSRVKCNKLMKTYENTKILSQGEQ